jgi:hypothetical protein
MAEDQTDVVASADEEKKFYDRERSFTRRKITERWRPGTIAPSRFYYPAKVQPADAIPTGFGADRVGVYAKKINRQFWEKNRMHANVKTTGKVLVHQFCKHLMSTVKNKAQINVPVYL